MSASVLDFGTLLIALCLNDEHIADCGRRAQPGQRYSLTSHDGEETTGFAGIDLGILKRVLPMNQFHLVDVRTDRPLGRVTARQLWVAAGFQDDAVDIVLAKVPEGWALRYRR